jgi:hypothetical protein
VSHKKRQWKGRAADALADEMFERALLGDDHPARRSFDPREDRKTRQLCQQARRALMLALAGECDDDVLRDVYVEAVEPLDGGSQLLVRVILSAGTDVTRAEVATRLEIRSARLRAIVAGAICRKRAPGLSFIVVPPSNERFEGGTP